MSIRHEVTIFCDTCGNWEHGNGESTRSRRKRGWKSWQDDHGHWRHACPGCSPALSTSGEVKPT